MFASTSEVYAGTLEHGDLPVPTPEETALALPPLGRPRTSYMLSKIYGEALCHHAGVPFTIVRPHNVYGPRMGMAHVIPELMAKVTRAEDSGLFEVFSVDQTRTFCYVDDAVAMIAAAADSKDCAGETLNIGADGPEIAIGELARRILLTVGKSLEIVPRPAPAGSPARRCPDMSKTRRLTGVDAQVPLDEGLARTYVWYRDRGFFTRSETA